MQSITCTVFKKFKVNQNQPLLDLAKEIKSEKHKLKVDKIRQFIKEGKKEEAQSLKKQMPFFTPSGVFDGKRNKESLTEYSKIVCLDFDKISPDAFIPSLNKIEELPYTSVCFKSPSGVGLKVFVKVDSEAVDHEIAYEQVRAHYEEFVGIKADSLCKDITRACFMSYDPDLYENSEAKTFIIETECEEPKTIHDIVDWSDVLQECSLYTEKIEVYQESSRNKFIYLFASNANRRGVPVESAIQYCLDKYTDLPPMEIRSTILSSYSHHEKEFAKFADFEGLQDNQSDLLKNTPIIPEALYLRMPEILKEGCMAFNVQRERDVFLTGALAILSGCTPFVTGVYDGQIVYTNLYSFTVAPPASGKGVLRYAKKLLDEYHKSIVSSSRDLLIFYEKDLVEYRDHQTSKNKKNNTVDAPPKKPSFKVVLIPANTSCAKIIYHLDQNEGTGIICETEADSLGNVLKQEWGNFSDILRKAYHHERISFSRRSSEEFIEINYPRLSVALTGTFNQVKGIIISPENGLFSRFLYYVFEAEQSWKDVSPAANTINMSVHFKKLSLRVHEMVHFLRKRETLIDLSSTQWGKLNATCGRWLNESIIFNSAESASIVKRLGLIIFRISCLFTAMRKFEQRLDTDNMICSDDDFNTALGLTEIYLQHSLLLFNKLPSHRENDFLKGENKRGFFNALPTEFTRQQAILIASKFNISPRTADELLKRLLGKKLNQPKNGNYKKI